MISCFLKVDVVLEDLITLGKAIFERFVFYTQLAGDPSIFSGMNKFSSIYINLKKVIIKLQNLWYSFFTSWISIALEVYTCTSTP